MSKAVTCFPNTFWIKKIAIYKNVQYILSKTLFFIWSCHVKSCDGLREFGDMYQSCKQQNCFWHLFKKILHLRYSYSPSFTHWTSNKHRF